MARVGLILEGRRIAREESPIHIDGDKVGRVTSGTFSPTLQKVIAMAYVPVASSSPGTVVDVNLRGTLVPANGRCSAVLQTQAHQSVQPENSRESRFRRFPEFVKLRSFQLSILFLRFVTMADRELQRVPAKSYQAILRQQRSDRRTATG